MKCNVALFDRLVRFLFGTLLLTWALCGGPTWAYFGLYLLVTSGWGFCLIYGIFKINTIKDLTNSPQLMSGIPRDDD